MLLIQSEKSHIGYIYTQKARLVHCNICIMYFAASNYKSFGNILTYQFFKTPHVCLTNEQVITNWRHASYFIYLVHSLNPSLAAIFEFGMQNSQRNFQSKKFVKS
jgi:hypothetical protein